MVGYNEALDNYVRCKAESEALDGKDHINFSIFAGGLAGMVGLSSWSKKLCDEGLAEQKKNKEKELNAAMEQKLREREARERSEASKDQSLEKVKQVYKDRYGSEWKEKFNEDYFDVTHVRGSVSGVTPESTRRTVDVNVTHRKGG